MSILSVSNTRPSHNVLPLECGGKLTCKWDYVQSEVNKVRQLCNTMYVLYVLCKVAWLVTVAMNWRDSPKNTVLD